MYLQELRIKNQFAYYVHLQKMIFENTTFRISSTSADLKREKKFRRVKYWTLLFRTRVWCLAVLACGVL